MPPARVDHFTTPAGRDPIAEFLEAQRPVERASCDLVIERLADGTIEHFPRFRSYVGDGIWELRVSSAGKQFRFLYAVEGSRAIILDAFVKKTQQLPERHLRLAKRRLGELRQRGTRHGS